MFELVVYRYSSRLKMDKIFVCFNLIIFNSAGGDLKHLFNTPPTTQQVDHIFSVAL
jgi:hypothetical protein